MPVPEIDDSCYGCAVCNIFAISSLNNSGNCKTLVVAWLNWWVPG